jgi:hypothetical protein
MQQKIKKGEYLELLLRFPKTILSTKDVALLWGEASTGATRVRLSYYVKTGKLIHVHHGLYAKDENYDHFELATRIYTPSYISLETVLTRVGINFQYYSNIFVASYVNRELKIDGQTYTIRRIKPDVLSNTMGIEHKDGYAIATKERAFLDKIYLSQDYHFDYLGSMDWDKVFQILPIYQNKRMSKKVNEYFKFYKKIK